MSAQPIKIAILAMGGEGGGVLADWIVDLAEQNGHVAQTTSVPGVAQRTGATIYYLELFPRAAADVDGRQPVLAMMPLPGDVDVVLASEAMEAARAVERGLVTPDRTTLIASTHRVYAIAEKMAMGDARVDSAALIEQARRAARQLVAFDMARTAEQTGSVISAVLFGALAASKTLPFDQQAFEATIERGGLSVAASLRAFREGLATTSGQNDSKIERVPETDEAAPSNAQPIAEAVTALVARVQAFPADARGLVTEGVRRLIDYQDPAYAALYLDRLAQLNFEPTVQAEAARHLALWMSYEDTIRVADLKTRSSRLARVHAESRRTPQQLVQVQEFLKPGVQEICDTLPPSLARWVEGSAGLRRLIERLTQDGSVVRTSSLPGFLLLYGLAGLRRWRRGTRRFQLENQRIEQWFAQAVEAARTDAPLAIEILRCQRLIKGYGGTHERGWRNFSTVLGAALEQPATAAATLRRLREAALSDEDGVALGAALSGLKAA